MYLTLTPIKNHVMLGGEIMNKKKTMTALIIVLAVLFIGIGYAAISTVTLNIVGNAQVTPGDDSFVVHFPYTSGESNTISYTASTGYTATANTNGTYTSLTDATINAMDFTKKDQYVDYTISVKNDSPELSATIASTNITISSGNQYLEAALLDNFSTVTIAAGQTGTFTLRVKCIKTPTSTESLTGFTVAIHPQPALAN